jgi:hypothetical protein
VVPRHVGGCYQCDVLANAKVNDLDGFGKDIVSAPRSASRR